MSSLYYETISYLLEQAPSLECDEGFLDRVMHRVNNAPQHEDVPGTRFRASSIGKPWVVQLLDKWYGKRRRYTIAAMMNMGNGKFTQELLAEILSLSKVGFKQEVGVRMYRVTGHVDFVLERGDEVLVIECKSMASHLVSSFCNSPNDSYGYLSQLSFYWACVKQMYPTKNVSAMFAVFDRSMSKFRCVQISPMALEKCVARIESSVGRLAAIKDYDVDALAELLPLMIPPAMGGKIPDSVARSRWASMLYTHTADGYEVAPIESIVLQLKSIPQERGDLMPLTYEE